MTFAALSNARAQTDTTRPAICCFDAQGGTTFTSLPSPLTGQLFDAGGAQGLWMSVQLVRTHAQGMQWWNGTAWVSSQAYSIAVIDPAGADHTYSWSTNVSWPSGADLPRGAYHFYLFAMDAASNSSFVDRTVIIGAPDTTPPTVSVTTPAANALIDSAQQGLNSIIGTVNDGDGSGVAAVKVALCRNWSGQAQLWNGTSWSNDWFAFDAALGAPDAQGNRTWSLSANLPPRAQLGTGQYFVNATAADCNGNPGYAPLRFFNVAPLDTVAPTVTLAFPAEGQQLTTLPAIRGTSADIGSGVSSVRVWLNRTITGTGGATTTQYWTGSAWSASFDYFGTLPDCADTGWTRNQNLPAGAQLGPGYYAIWVCATDRYNNSSEVLSRNFTIVPTPSLSIDAHLRADASQSWLGEGFANANAQGQTLAGAIAAGQTQTRDVRFVLRGGATSKTVRVTLPDWASFAGAGWSARFFDAPQNGNDITAQITGASGWTTAMSDGQAKQIRVEVTAPANALANATNALTLRVEADPTSETSALDVVKATWQVLAPTPDLTIRAQNSAWIGENVRNTDGNDQTLERVAPSSHVVRGQIKLSVANARNGQPVKWSVPGWDAFRADGWSARFFDTLNGNTEITGLITNEGWTSQSANGADRIIGWEVTAPTDATNLTRVLSVRAQIGDGAGAVADVVKASVQVLPNVRPDVSIRYLRSDETIQTSADVEAGEWIGKEQWSPQIQKSEVAALRNRTEKVAVRIFNPNGAAARFLFKSPAIAPGWSLKIYDAPQDGNLLEFEGDSLVTPPIAPDEALIWRVVIVCDDNAATELSLPLRFGSGGTAFDECTIAALVQSISRLEWSDGSHWFEVGDSDVLQVEQSATIGVRAIKRHPNSPWPAGYSLGPVWQWQNEAPVLRETVWLHGRTPTGVAGQSATVTMGEPKMLTLRVLPHCTVDISVSRQDLMAGAGPSTLNTTLVNARVTDDAGEPLQNQRVRLRAFHEDGSAAGTWPGGGAETIVNTSDEGIIAALWTSDATAGEVRFEAAVVTDAAPTGDAVSHININVNAPYSLLKVGSWAEDNAGQWSRPVTVETWYGNQKVGGIAVALASAVTDYEAEAPLAGWQNAAPFDAATGTSNADGVFATIQRFNPFEAGAWPHDYEIDVEATVNPAN